MKARRRNAILVLQTWITTALFLSRAPRQCCPRCSNRGAQNRIATCGARLHRFHHRSDATKGAKMGGDVGRTQPAATAHGRYPHPMWLCYKHAAVELGVHRAGATDHRSESRQGARNELGGTEAATADERSGTIPAEQSTVSHLPVTAVREDASRFCPVCSQRLESRRCKLICCVCGYYMSCADYY
jgi:hypothetical protein